MVGSHETLGKSHWFVGAGPNGEKPPLLWTENETNMKKLYGIDHYTTYYKDAFNRFVSFFPPSLPPTLYFFSLITSFSAFVLYPLPPLSLQIYYKW